MPTGIYVRTEEHKRKIGLAHKGRKRSTETIRRISEALKGHIIAEETRKKISLSNLGTNAPFYNKHHSKETKIKMSKSQLGNKNHLWKGDKVSYKALHKWVRRHKIKPNLCEKCKINPPEEISNISGDYKRDLDDYEWLCIKCHRKKDAAKRRKEGRIPIRDKTGKFIIWKNCSDYEAKLISE